MVLHYQLEKQKRPSGAPPAPLMKRFLHSSATEHLFHCNLNSVLIGMLPLKRKTVNE